MSPLLTSAGRHRWPTRLLEALATPHPPGAVLEHLGLVWHPDEVRARVVEVSRPNPRTVVLTLAPNATWRGHRAGQHVQVTVEVGGRLRTRCYSVVSPAGRDERPIELAVRALPGGAVSTQLRDAARPGHVLRMSQAQGDFVLPERPPPHLVLVSGGTGITPVLSMLDTHCRSGRPGRVTFLHYTPSLADVPLRSRLEALAARYRDVDVHLVGTRRSGSTSVHFSPDHLPALDPATAEVFACGPPALLDDVGTWWAEQAPDRPGAYHVERFVADPAPPVVGTGDGQLRFTRSGIEVTDDGRSLLEQAESAGVAVPTGCRMGICHTCTSTLAAGTVRDRRTGTTTSTGTGGRQAIQVCASVALGDIAIEI